MPDERRTRASANDSRSIVRTASNPDWAWEFMRRNSEYRLDYQRRRRSGVTKFKLVSGATLVRARRASPDAERWGLLHFADPDKSPKDTAIFWKPDLIKSSIEVTMSQNSSVDENRSASEAQIVLSELDADRVILDQFDGTRHIVLRRQSFWLQLYCRSPAPAGDAALLGVVINDFSRSSRALDGVKQLLSLHRSDGCTPLLTGRRTNELRLKRMINALDVHASGGSYRDIAKAVHGHERVDAEWRLGSLKEEARYLLKSAKSMVNGGYLALLSKRGI